ncbi:MAG TPA: hypothetical protein VFG83_15440 [Kofleriaceae bacterium]|nr:hypothetical protein [Kofleriaceae bacterium]
MTLIRLGSGFIKGAVIGGALGYGAYAAGLSGGFEWVLCAVTGAVVGLLCGRPVWAHLFDRSSTVWVAVIKAVVGAGIAVGLFAAARAWGGMDLSLLGETRNALDWPFVVAGAVGALYGAWVEADDAPAKKKAAPKEPAAP